MVSHFPTLGNGWAYLTAKAVWRQQEPTRIMHVIQTSLKGLKPPLLITSTAETEPLT